MRSLADLKLDIPLVCPDVWLVDFSDLNETDIDHSLLDTHEEARLERMKRPTDRVAFASMRVTLKMLLTTYLGHESSAIHLQYRDNGKPYLPDIPNLHFNVSHSHGRGVIAFSSAAPVGVDIEPLIRFQALSTSFWSAVLSANEHCMAPTFCEAELRLMKRVHIWVRKEAVLKMLGFGLAMPMKSFEVTKGEINIAISEPWQRFGINQEYLSSSRVLSSAWDEYRWALCFSPIDATPKVRGVLNGTFHLCGEPLNLAM